MNVLEIDTDDLSEEDVYALSRGIDILLEKGYQIATKDALVVHDYSRNEDIRGEPCENLIG